MAHRKPKGSTAWAILRLRNEAGQLREKGRDQNSVYSLQQRVALLDAAGSADAMAACIQDDDRRRLHENNREFDQHIEDAGYAVPMGKNYGRPRGDNPVDQIVKTWEKDRREEAEAHGDHSFTLVRDEG